MLEKVKELKTKLLIKKINNKLKGKAVIVDEECIVHSYIDFEEIIREIKYINRTCNKQIRAVKVIG